MFLGKRYLIEERNVSNGSTAENFVNVFDDAATLGYKNVLVEVEGLDESGSNIALRYYNSAGSLQSGNNYNHSYYRICNTDGNTYVQNVGASHTNRHYDALWKSGNNCIIYFPNPTAANDTVSIITDMRFNAAFIGQHNSAASMGGFRLYNDAGGTFTVTTTGSEYARIRVYGVEES